MSSTISTDVIHRFMFDNSDIHGEIITLTATVEDALAHQNIPQALHRTLGEFFVGAAMLADVLKIEGTVILQARGNGQIPLVMAEANHHGHLRGILNADTETSFTMDDSSTTKPLSELIGDGTLALTLDPKQGERYQGIVPLDGGSLSTCLDHYFERSEQIPTKVIFFNDGKHYGGLFLQCLPAQHVTDSEIREEQWQTALQLAATLKAEEFFSVDHATVLYRLFHEQNCRIFEPKSLSFQCSCSKERSARALQAMETKELLEIIESQGVLTLDCQFCGKEYHYYKDDILALNQKNAMH